MSCSMIPYYEKSESIYLNLPPEKQGGKYAESKLYALLREQLPDNWYVIYSLFFQRELQSNEMDFLVLVPGKGMVYLECKGDGYIAQRGGSEFSFPKNKQQNFTLQERQGVIKNFAQEIQKNFFPEERYTPIFSYAVIFPTVNITTTGSSYANDGDFQPFDFQGLPVFTKKDLRVTAENPSPLKLIVEKPLEGRLRQWGETYFQEAEAGRVFEHYSITAATTNEMCDINGDHFNQGLDLLFEGAAEDPTNFVLREGAYKYVAGAAGTGKTWIAIESAKRFAQQYKQQHSGEKCRILYVCYNTLLAAEIEIRNQDFKELSVANFHRLEQICLNTKSCLPDTPFDEQARDKEIHDRLYEAIHKKTLKKYDMILVDEAQDFNRCKIETLCMLAKSQGRKIAFFADTEQDIHPSNEQNPIVSAIGRDIEKYPLLTKAIRYSGNIQKHAAKQIKDTKTSSIKDSGPEVTIFEKATFNTIKDALSALKNIPPSRIAILWDGLQFKDQEKEIRSNLRNCLVQTFRLLGEKKPYGETKKDLKVWHSADNVRYLWATSLQKFKGLEASYVLLLLKGTTTLPASHYVGATRAKYKLFVFLMQ